MTEAERNSVVSGCVGEGRKACFFSTDAHLIGSQSYLRQDVRILERLGFEVTVTNSPGTPVFHDFDLYYSWWATGSAISVFSALVRSRPSFIVVGGNEVMLTRDSMSGHPVGYLGYPVHKKLAARFSVSKASIVTAVSNFMVADVQALTGRMPEVVHNSIDTELFKPGSAGGSQDTMSSPDQKTVILVANFDAQAYQIKRTETAITAFKSVCQQVASCRLLIIGREGPMLSVAKQLVVLLGLQRHVEFHPLVPVARFASILRSASVLLQVSDTETFGQSVLEAVSAGVPVVVSRRGALPEVVAEHGIYVDHNSPASIASGVVTALGIGPSERERRAFRAHDYVRKNFSFDVRLSKVSALLNRLFDTPR